MRIEKYILSVIFLVCFAFNTKAQNLNESMLKGVSAFMNGDYQSAINSFSEKESVLFSKGYLLQMRADSYFNLEKYDNAITDYLRLTRKMPLEANFSLAKTYAKLNDSKNASLYATKCLIYKNPMPESTFLTEESFENIESSNEWLSIWNKDYYTQYELDYEEALFYYKNEDYDKALNILDDIITKSNIDFRVFKLRGEIFEILEDYEAAVLDYDVYVSKQRANYNSYATRGKALLKAEKPKQALVDLEKAFKRMPYDLSLYPSLAKACNLLDKQDEANEYINTYLTYVSKKNGDMFEIGALYYELGDYISSLQYLSQAIEQKPGDSRAYSLRAAVYSKTDMHEYALMDYAMSLDLNPTNPETYISRALLRQSLGDNKGCCYDLSKAVYLGSKKAANLRTKYCTVVK